MALVRLSPAGGRLAQLGEHRVRNAGVGGSNPLPSTILTRSAQRHSSPNIQSRISEALKDYSSVAFDDEDGLVVNKILIADLPEIIVSSYGIIQEGITDFLRRLAVMVPHHRFKLLALFLVAAVVDSVGVKQ